MCPNNVFTFQHLKMIPIFILLYHTQISFVSLYCIRILQTWNKSRANHMLHHELFKNHIGCASKPISFPQACTLTPTPKINFFAIFYIQPHCSAAWKNSYKHQSIRCTLSTPNDILMYIHMKKNRTIFCNHLWLTILCLALGAQISKIVLRQPQFHNVFSISHKLNAKIFL